MPWADPTPGARTPPPGGTGFRKDGEEEVFRGWVLTVGRARYTDPDGSPFERYVVHHPGAVAVVAVDETGAATLVRQLRPALGLEVLEIPAGTCDVPGEPAERTARRELAEEAGLEATELRLLASVYNSPGVTDQRTAVYLATGLSSCPPERRGHEERWLTTRQVRLEDVETLVATGELADASTVLGLLLARRALAGDG